MPIIVTEITLAASITATSLFITTPHSALLETHGNYRAVGEKNNMRLL